MKLHKIYYAHILCNFIFFEGYIRINPKHRTNTENEPEISNRTYKSSENTRSKKNKEKKKGFFRERSCDLMH